MRSFLILIFFCYSGLVLADSTSLAPVQALPTAPNYMKSYTQANALPSSDVAAFVSDLSNMCRATNETRTTCFVQYTVIANPAGGVPNYILPNPYLQCPMGYFPVATFGNNFLDPTSQSTQIFYYGEITNYSPGSTIELNSLIAANASCVPDTTKAELLGGDQAIEQGCGSPGQAPLITTVGSLPAMKVNNNNTNATYTYQQDTYKNNGLVVANQRCTHDTADSGCPVWCSRMWWERYDYYPPSCTRPAGLYKINTSLTVPPGGQYVPTTFICSKPTVTWKPSI